jgi:hypothetical protein
MEIDVTSSSADTLKAIGAPCEVLPNHPPARLAELGPVELPQASATPQQPITATSQRAFRCTAHPALGSTAVREV